MRRNREVWRQKWARGRSHREVARSLGISLGAVSTALARARAAGLGCWEAVLALGEVELEHHLYTYGRGSSSARPLPDWGEVHAELAKKGVTLQLPPIEYLERHSDGSASTPFLDAYRLLRPEPSRSPPPAPTASCPLRPSHAVSIMRSTALSSTTRILAILPSRSSSEPLVCSAPARQPRLPDHPVTPFLRLNQRLRAAA